MIDASVTPSLTAGEVLLPARRYLRAHGWAGNQPAMLVLGENQTLYLFTDDQLLGQWQVSTGLAGFGCREGSGCTPVGLHRVAQAIGEEAPLGAVFKGREFTGQILPQAEGAGTDLVTTRILWLEGLQPGVNQGEGIDSKDRYIYIHGTPQVAFLGQPVSAGCVRLAPEDVVTLYQQVGVGTLLLIWPTLADAGEV
ncbi:MAG: L,D-transpeptidase [Magnetococcales bacterium]|nr:L,D-transpeptidase [Magnetococcales bacterium]NGZ25716.1 L,D-transpeptidase [Magnetococcales bacterium]